MAVIRLEELFPEQLQAQMESCPLLVVPFGTIEWHSHHLPVGLDGIVAQALCDAVTQQTRGVLAPVSYWAVGGVPFPYTLNLPTEVIEPLLEFVFNQFSDMGFKVIVGFTGHFGLDQTLTLKRAALKVMQHSDTTILPLTEYDLVTDSYKGDHAALGETSLLLNIRPDLVRLDEVPLPKPLEGIIGDDPRGSATAELGKQLFDNISARTAELALRMLKDTSVVQRQDYLLALSAGVDVLEKTAHQRKVMARKGVPPIATPAYLSHCQAIYAGDYHAAQKHAERKFANLAE